MLPQPPAGLFQGPQTLITGISLLSRLEQRENKGVTVRPVTELELFLAHKWHSVTSGWMDRWMMDGWWMDGRMRDEWIKGQMMNGRMNDGRMNE